MKLFTLKKELLGTVEGVQTEEQKAYARSLLDPFLSLDLEVFGSLSKSLVMELLFLIRICSEDLSEKIKAHNVVVKEVKDQGLPLVNTLSQMKTLEEYLISLFPDKDFPILMNVSPVSEDHFGYDQETKAFYRLAIPQDSESPMQFIIEKLLNMPENLRERAMEVLEIKLHKVSSANNETLDALLEAGFLVRGNSVVRKELTSRVVRRGVQLLENAETEEEVLHALSLVPGFEVPVE